MESDSASSSPPLHKSRVRFRVRFFPILFLCFFFIINISPTTSNPSQDTQSLYTKHCNHIVPASTRADFKRVANSISLRLSTGYFTGGDRILGRSSLPAANSSKSFSFLPLSVHSTDAESVSEVEARFIFGRVYSFLGNRILYDLRVRGPRIPVRKSGTDFMLHGFWSSSSGKLCMVGSGSSHSKEGNRIDHSVVLKLNYPKNSTIVTCLVSGVLESLDSEDSLNYFEPISVLGVSDVNYEYTLIERESENGSFGGHDGVENESLSIGTDRSFCASIGRSFSPFTLEYGSECDSINCNPLGGAIGLLPNILWFRRIQCTENGRARWLIGFSNSSDDGDRRLFVPETTLVAEGAWDAKNKQLRVIACRVFNFTDSLANASVGDCSIKLNVRFPTIFSIRNRRTVEGQIWSNRSVNDSDYFGRLGFWSSQYKTVNPRGSRYEYSEIDSVRKLCAKKNTVKHKGRVYPSGYSFDMKFDMSVRNSKRQRAQGYSSPFSVGDVFYGRWSTLSAVQVVTNHSSLLNISYMMSFTPHPDFKLGGETFSGKSVEISAEGLYDTESGVLCMRGCRHLGSNNQKSTKNDSLDCDILINVQFPPLNSKGDVNVKGTIESTRGKSDHFYFERLELSSNSIYVGQAAKSIWRMDLEITMVLISNTFACVLVGLQLFYVKKHPDVLPFISVVMLIVLTLGHMIPLLLNFEALFLANRNRQNVFLDSGGWLEVNEVIVRVVTMIAFLLQFRLLQMTWSSRLKDGNQKGLWVSEKKVLYMSLPLYVGGGLIAWFVHRWKNSYQSPFLRPHYVGHHMSSFQQPSFQQHSLWGVLKSYAGLILDGFLFPQILFNLFFNSREKALASSFYVGTTVVRLLPHAYDLYRAHNSAGHFDLSYIYANPRMDFYSTAWDVIIPCGGLLFAVLIYLQQRFGGRCILPKRFKESSMYEMVPVVSSE